MPGQDKNKFFALPCSRAGQGGSAGQVCPALWTSLVWSKKEEYDGYLKRYKKGIIGSILGRQVHRLCYRSIIQSGPLTITRSTTDP